MIRQKRAILALTLQGSLFCLSGEFSRWLTGASYLVLKNINMSNSLPKAWVNALTLESIRLNLSCENAFTCTKRRGMNPQQSFNGYQYNYLVTPRVFTIGVDVKF